MANNSTAAVTYTDYITPEDTYLIPDKSQHMDAFRRYREANLFALIALFFSMKPTKQTKFSHFEFDTLITPVKLATTLAVGGGAGNAATFEIASPYENSGAFSPLKEKQLVTITDGTNRFQAYVTAKDETTANAHTITLFPQNPTVDLAAVTLTGDGTYVILNSNTKSDGSDYPKSEFRLPEEIINYTQIFSEKWEGGESAMADHVWYNNRDNNPYLHLTFAEDTIDRHYHQVMYQLLFGRLEANQALVDPFTNRPAQTTKGLEQHIEESGVVETYATFGLTDLENLIRGLKRNGAPRRYIALPGYELNFQLNNFLATQNQTYGGQTDFAQLRNEKFFEDAKRVFDLNFGGIRYGNMELMIAEADFMGYAGNTGFIDSSGNISEPYPSRALIIPDGGMNVHPEQGAANTTYVDHLCLRYKDNGRVTRGVMNEIGKPGWVPDKIQKNMENLRRLTSYTMRDRQHTGTDNVQMLMNTEVGLQVVGATYMAKLEQ